MSEATAEQEILRIINLNVALPAVQSAATQQALGLWLGHAVHWQQASLADLAEVAQPRSDRTGSGQIGSLVLIYPSLATALNRAQGDVLAADRAIVGWQELVEAILRFYRKRRAATFLLASDAVFDSPDELRRRLVQWAGPRTIEVGKADAEQAGGAALPVAEPAIGAVMAGYLQLSCHPLRKLSEELAAGGMALLPNAEMALQTTTQALQNLATQHSDHAARTVVLQAALAQEQQDHLAGLHAAVEVAVAASQAEKTVLEHQIASQQAQLVAMQGLIEQEFIARQQQQTAVTAIDTAQKVGLEQKTAQQAALLQLERSKAEAALSEQRRVLAELLKQGQQEASRISDLQTELRHQTALLHDRDSKISGLIGHIRQQAEVIAATEVAMQAAQGETQTEVGLRQQKETEVAALIGSTSWKVTKPLRALRGAGKIQP
jgi:hypothetical protein